MTVTAKVEDQVWSQEVAYWGYLQSADLEGYVSLFHNEFMGWPNNQPAPMNRIAVFQLMSTALPGIQPDTVRIEPEPRSVGYFGDICIVHGQVSVRAKAQDGTEIARDERFTHTWLRTAEGWKIIGGMSAPLSGA